MQLEYFLMTYELTEKTDIKISVTNAQGNLVRMIEQVNRFPGTYTASWNGKDERDQLALSGDYFIHLEAQGFMASLPVIVENQFFDRSDPNPAKANSLGQFINLYNPKSGDLLIPYFLDKDSSVSLDLDKSIQLHSKLDHQYIQ